MRIVHFDETGCVYNGDSPLKKKNEGDKGTFHRADSVKMKKEVEKVQKRRNIARFFADMSVRKLTR